MLTDQKMVKINQSTSRQRDPRRKAAFWPINLLQRKMNERPGMGQTVKG